MRNNLRTIVISKKNILIFFICLVFVFCLCFFPSLIKNTSTKADRYTIVIDAGHGGLDGGSIGVSGTIESEINLEYAKTLCEMCNQFGMKVVMTRTNSNGLYSSFASNKKKDDMKARKEIIEKTKPDIVVSIHMNSFSLQSAKGAQVFYDKNNENSKLLAQNIQKMFVKNIENSKEKSMMGDYYIVNCTNYTSVIVECGYLSNFEEEKLLCTKSHKDKLCYNILCGILSYLSLR